MFQRLEKMRKHAFGSMIIFGKNKETSIGGVWIWRSHELAFTVSAMTCFFCYSRWYDWPSSRDSLYKFFSLLLLFNTVYSPCLVFGSLLPLFNVPVGSPSCDGDVSVINQPCFPTLFYSVLVYSVSMALWTVFHSINFPDYSQLSVLTVLSLPNLSFQLYLSLWKSPSALI